MGREWGCCLGCKAVKTWFTKACGWFWLADMYGSGHKDWDQPDANPCTLFVNFREFAESFRFPIALMDSRATLFVHVQALLPFQH